MTRINYTDKINYDPKDKEVIDFAKVIKEDFMEHKREVCTPHNLNTVQDYEEECKKRSILDILKDKFDINSENVFIHYCARSLSINIQIKCSILFWWFFKKNIYREIFKIKAPGTLLEIEKVKNFMLLDKLNETEVKGKLEL